MKIFILLILILINCDTGKNGSSVVKNTSICSPSIQEGEKAFLFSNNINGPEIKCKIAQGEKYSMNSSVPLQYSVHGFFQKIDIFLIENNVIEFELKETLNYDALKSVNIFQSKGTITYDVKGNGNLIISSNFTDFVIDKNSNFILEVFEDQGKQRNCNVITFLNGEPFKAYRNIFRYLELENISDKDHKRILDFSKKMEPFVIDKKNKRYPICDDILRDILKKEKLIK